MRIPVITESAPAQLTGAPSDWSSALRRGGAIGLGAIWAAVVAISVFAPDLVSGSEQDQVPIAAILTWVWGLIASRSLVVALLAARGRPDRAGDVRLLVGFVMAVWVVAAVVGVFGPEIVSGSDPTHIPICAVLAPIAAMVLTTTAGQLFTSLDERRAQP